MWKVLIVFATLLFKVKVGVSFEDFYSTNMNFRISGIESNNISAYRLLNNTCPEIYKIQLVINDFQHEDSSFFGNVQIKIKVLKNTNIIVLHSAVLILNTTLRKSDFNGPFVAHTHDVEVEKEFLLIKTTEEMLETNSILWLNIDYIGFISFSTNKGMFRQRFIDSHGNEG